MYNIFAFLGFLYSSTILATKRTHFGVGVIGITDRNNVGASRLELSTHSQVNILLGEEEGKVEPDISITFWLHKFFTKYKFTDRFVLAGNLIYPK